jgi:alpha-glucosidase (family GH31 glycosyl hydrolase)
MLRPSLRQPEDLLRYASAAARAVTLRHTRVFAWTFFRRSSGGEISLTMPAPEPVAAGIVRVRLAAEHGRHMVLRLPAEEGERFVGFGERFNAVDQRGWKLETWAEEGAVGLGERMSPLLTRLGVSWNPFPKGPTTAYKPAPWFVSSRGYAILFETTLPVFFDVAATDPDSVACEVAGAEVSFLLFLGATPKELVSRLVEHTGKPRPLPDWALGPWNDTIGGEAEILRVADTLRTHGIPSSAIWTEDWGGGDWVLPGDNRLGWYSIFPVVRRPDPKMYPDLPSISSALHDRGFKLLGYFFPVSASVVGSKQGTQRSSGSQSAKGSRSFSLATAGRARCRQRPSEPARDRQVLGTKFPAPPIILSGTQ